MCCRSRHHTAGPPRTPPVQVKARGTSMCLAIPLLASNEGAELVVGDCTGGDSQLFAFSRTAAQGSYSMRVKHSAMCISATSSGPGAPLRQQACSGGEGQSFGLVSLAASPPSPSTPQAGPSSPSVPVGAIAGGVVGGIAVLVAAAWAYWLWVQRRRPAPAQLSTSEGMSGPPAPLKDEDSFDDLEGEPVRRPPVLPPLRDAKQMLAAQDAAGSTHDTKSAHDQRGAGRTESAV